VQTVPILGVLALAATLGAVLVGYGVLLPGLQHAALIDANLSHALAQPLYLRVGEIVLVASIALAAVVPKWAPTKRATPVALALAGAAAVHRLFILPAQGEAWARVDAVAQRPMEAFQAAQSWSDYHVLMTVVMTALLLVLVGLTIRRTGLSESA